jgi:hypothetical protein
VTQPEAWLRGPIPGIPALLQPVAHGLLQCREEMRANVVGLTADQIWSRPSGAASIGFHVRHAAGGWIDSSLMRGRAADSRSTGGSGGRSASRLTPTVGAALVVAFDEAVERAFEQLQSTSEATLGCPRRWTGQLPSTVLGLLFHAAEHAQRMSGQVVTTVRILRGERG